MTPCVETDWLLNRDGYGQRGSQKYAHREAYKVAHGPIPVGLKVRHKCDNPPCVNPEHLELGTQADNCDDMWSRGRGFSKLDPENVRQIRCLLSLGVSGVWLAKAFGVTPSTVSMILNGKRWSRGRG